MNKQLIEDEQSQNVMSIVELEKRLRGWLMGDWKAALYDLDDEAVGYILYQFRHDEYQPSIATAYVRQFFIAGAQRGKGIGRQAFELATKRFLRESSTIVIDLLEANAGAYAFWEAMGFEPYCRTMKCIREHDGIAEGK